MMYKELFLLRNTHFVIIIIIMFCIQNFRMLVNLGSIANLLLFDIGKRFTKILSGEKRKDIELISLQKTDLLEIFY